MKKIFLLVMSLFLTLSHPMAASAKTVVTGGPYTNLALTGQVITMKLTGYPTNAGFYMIECTRNSENSRPKLCNAASQLWISTSSGANFAPTADIQFRPTATYTYGGTNVDCLKVICGIFIRLDHMASADNSEDQFIPLSFVGGVTPTLPADVITASINRRTLRSEEPMKVQYNDSLTVLASAKSGATLTISTTSTGCSVTRNIVKILRGYGYCDLSISSPGNAQYAPTVKHYSLRMMPAEQEVKVGTNVRASTSITLPATSSVGAKVAYDLSSTGNCSLVINQSIYTLTFNKAGACRVRATAPALSDTYAALKQTLSFKIR